MLTPVEIVRQTGINRSALERYISESEIRKILGGEHTHPNYPDESLPMFQRIAVMHANKEVTPKTLAARLASEIRNPSSEIQNAELATRNSESETALIALPEQATTLLERLVEMTADRIACRALPPPEDRLITSAEAAELLACKPRSVKRYVAPVRPGVYKRSAILRYIQSL